MKEGDKYFNIRAVRIAVLVLKVGKMSSYKVTQQDMFLKALVVFSSLLTRVNE